MNLQDFVTETLVQIIKGVNAAHDVARTENAFINPRISSGPGFKSAHGIMSSFEGANVQVVSFDVALTVKEGTGTKGGIGVFAGMVSLGSAGQSNAENTSISHVKFSVPLSLPTQSIHPVS